MERGRVEINKQSTSGLHQSKNGMGTYYILVQIASYIYCKTRLLFFSPLYHRNTLAEKHLNGAMMRFKQGTELKVAGLGTEIRRELVPQDCADELHGRSTRRTRPKWYSNEVMCCSPSAVTSNSHEEAGEKGASSG